MRRKSRIKFDNDDRGVAVYTRKSRLTNKGDSIGVQFKQSGQWLLYRKYHDEGYTHSKTIDIVRSDGRPDVVMETKWTQKGRLFLYELLKDNGIIPVIERDMSKGA